MSVYTKAAKSPEITEREDRNRQLAREIATESVVLLKNNGILPMPIGKVAMYGAGVTKTTFGGTGSGEVNARYYVNLKEGMEHVGFQITNQTWLADYEEEYQKKREVFKKELMRKILRVRSVADGNEIFGTHYEAPVGRGIKESDVHESDTDTCIYVITRQAGEGKDRTVAEFQLKEKEIQHIRQCVKYYEKCIVLINTGSSMDIRPLQDMEGVDAICYICQLGEECGNAVADVLSGKVSPSGHLTETWVQKYEDVPYGNEFGAMAVNKTEADYKEGIYVGYRYYETANIPVQYAFGYGLSYANFTIQYRTIRNEKNMIFVEADVTNTHDYYFGKEVVQLYASHPKTGLSHPAKALVAFAKTKVLQPHETERVVLSFPVEDLAEYHTEKEAYVLMEGKYNMMLGNAANHTETVATVTVSEQCITEYCLPIDRAREEIEELVLPTPAQILGTEALPTVLIVAGDVPCTDNRKKEVAMVPDEILKKVDGFSDLACEKLVVGVGHDLISFKQYFTLPGYVGSTTSELFSLGVPNVVMNDGPAGLRLLRESVAYKNGKVKALGSIMSLMDYLPSWIGRFLQGNPKKGELLYQYTTAFPVGNAMSQTWNTALLEAEGRAISEEMSEYGTTYWLAPGMNIFRNPLCGRNFEYYGEDPLLTGKLAAAVVRGVESIPGNYATIKHFCCNNQEFLRNTYSANVNDRTLREIYLRPFKIAIQEGAPTGLMTSYNLTNGIYSLENKSLLKGFVRQECGFDGVIMTDWMATQKGCGDPVKALQAGNDLIMPGMASDHKQIKRALRKGNLNRTFIEQCAARILHRVMNSERVREESSN